MAMMNFFVITQAQRTDLMAMNDPNVGIDPPAINNPSPGVGINLNDNADDYAPGAVVTLSDDKYVAPKRMVDDPAYQHYVPDMVAYLLTLPWCSLETETIFIPEPMMDEDVP